MGGELLACDNLCDILTRMPVKDLARFKCVSKQWCNYVMDDSYLDENMHTKKAVKDDPMLIMFQQFPSDDILNEPCILNILDSRVEEDTGTIEVINKNQPIMELMFKEGGSRDHDNDIVLGSCNGLLYSSQAHPHDGTTLVVINPLRNECYQLPPIKIWSCTPRSQPRESCGLGFDESTNTFKMVCVVLREQVKRPRNAVRNVVKEDLCTMVHVLGTHSWREIPQIPYCPISSEGVFANGCLHWLVCDDLDSWPSYLGLTIIYFDMRKEEFGLIDPPKLQRPLGSTNEHLVDLNGEVGYVYNDIDNLSMEVWVLKQHTKWMMHCRFDQKPPLPKRLIKVLGFWNKDGDILMTNYSRGNLFVYRLKSGVLHEANLIGREYGCVTDIQLYQSSLFSVRCSISW